MTPEHKASLHDARDGDFVLVEQEGGYWYLFCISAFKLDDGELRVLIKCIHNPTRKDVWKYQQYGTWRFRLESWSRDSYDVRAVLRKTDVLTLRPEVEVLKRKFGCGCLYEHCERGLVSMTPATQLDVHFRASADRMQAHRARREFKSICPFCMGQTLFDQHEHLATSPNRYPVDVYAQHHFALNRSRQKLDYPPLDSDTNLATLELSSSALAQPLNSALHRNLVAHLKTKGTSPDDRPWALSTHSYTWFRTAKERVINDVCAICREAYDEGDVIADLPCLHFFHEGCVRQAFGCKTGMAKCPLCQSPVAQSKIGGGEATERNLDPITTEGPHIVEQDALQVVAIAGEFSHCDKSLVGQYEPLMEKRMDYLEAADIFWFDASRAISKTVWGRRRWINTSSYHHDWLATRIRRGEDALFRHARRLRCCVTTSGLWAWPVGLSFVSQPDLLVGVPPMAKSAMHSMHVATRSTLHAFSASPPDIRNAGVPGVPGVPGCLKSLCRQRFMDFPIAAIVVLLLDMEGDSIRGIPIHTQAQVTVESLRRLTPLELLRELSDRKRTVFLHFDATSGNVWVVICLSSCNLLAQWDNRKTQ
ncbi:hypothetical protein DOTSEDRAFT_38420 [Dothistroma septosporum NZE10]|uniref:RING-type domain-containing protein n=1 Tax=Dothistroma septosporum (strain NZE10 / CBS 128990) TaxID=675120 RepID=M2Y1K7_DOTSN|nr:hypothetical protein DOTSEDRAFT_38420 [Dothistroma septosporum NZE10]